MIEIPRLKPHLRAEIAGDGMVFLVSEHERFLLRGQHYEFVVACIDGQRSAEQIIEALDGKLSPLDVSYTLAMLRKQAS